MSEQDDLEAAAWAAWDRVAQAISEAQEATRKAQAVPAEGESARSPDPPPPRSKDKSDDQSRRQQVPSLVSSTTIPRSKGWSRIRSALDRIGGGLLLAVVGGVALAVPFISISNSGANGALNATTNLSVFTANSLCSSGLGALAQAGDQSIANDCTAVNIGFYLGWLAVLVGVGFIVWGLVRMLPD
jgi:hypothetical protein